MVEEKSSNVRSEATYKICKIFELQRGKERTDIEMTKEIKKKSGSRINSRAQFKPPGVANDSGGKSRSNESR